MKKDLLRTVLACWVLLFIALSNLYINFSTLQVHISFLTLFFTIPLLTQLNRPYYHLFTSITIMVGYAAIQFWEQMTPIWFFLVKPALIPLFCLLLISLLTNHFYNRLITGVLGLTSGEFLYRIILFSYDLNSMIGDMAFYNHLLITILLLLLLDLFGKGKNKLRALLFAWKQSTTVENKKYIS